MAVAFPVEEDREQARLSELLKWDKICKKGVAAFLESRPTDFWRRVHRGIPAEHRWAVWKARLLTANAVTNRREAIERETALFSGPSAAICTAGLLSRDSSWSQAITTDAPRTLPDYLEFTVEHQNSLCRVLNAYAFLNPQVGYVQGMGCVVGVLLMTSECSECETLFVFARLMEDCGLAGFYKEGFPLLDQYVQTFDVLLGELAPGLKRHFAAEGIQSSDFLHKWLLSLFIGCLPLQTVLLIWDMVMCSGLPHLVLAAIALLSSVEEILLAKNREDIMQFFMYMKQSEEEVSAIEVGRYISKQMGRLGSMPSVQSQLIALEGLAQRVLPVRADELNWRFDLDCKDSTKKLKAGSKTGRRVSFDLDADVDDSYMNWHGQYMFMNIGS